MSSPVWNLQQKIYYGGYQLPVTKISYSSRSEYDSTGNVLQGYTTTFRLTLFVNEPSSSVLFSRLNNLHAILSRPRQEFRWDFSDEVVFQVWPASDVDGNRDPGTNAVMYDRRWGPKPRITNIEKHINGLSANISVEIECFCNHCPGSSAADFEEAWWTFSYSMDMNYSCTRTVSGKYRLRSPLQAGEILKDGGYFPPLPKSFQRHDIKHDLSADGLVLTFTVTDKQKWRTFPRPITDGNAVFSISQRGGTMVKSLVGGFEAPNDVNKRIIVQFIIAFVMARFPALARGDTKEIINEFKISNDEFANKVNFSVQTTTPADVLFPAGGQPNFGAISELGWGDVADIAPGIDDTWEQVDGYNRIMPMTGTAGLIPYALQPYQMCAPGSEVPMDEWNPVQVPPEYSGGPGTSEAVQDGPSPGESDAISDAKTTIWTTDHQNAPYLSYSESIQFTIDYGIVTQVNTSTTGGNTTQQMHQPIITIYQAGAASRFAIPPAEGKFIFAGSVMGNQETEKMVKRQVTRDAPQFVGDGVTPLHRVSWCYTISVPLATKLGDGGAGDADAGNVDILIPPNVIIDYTSSIVAANPGNYAASVKTPGNTVNSDGTFTGYYPGK